MTGRGTVRGGSLAALAALAALGACDTPPLRIAFELSGGPTQACPAPSVAIPPTCSDVPMLCDAVLNIRIVRPSAPQETYLPLCEDIPFVRGGDRDLCPIANIDLPSSRLPKETLEVQVMIWPRGAVKEDPITGALDCREIYGQPVLTMFGVDGFPLEISPAPALGGRAFYHPGDEQTVVRLGCLDLQAVNQAACLGGIEVSAAVNEFERPARSVAPAMVPDLLVSVAEPIWNGSEYRIESTSPLAAEAATPNVDPRWLASIEKPNIQDTLCVQVIGTNGSNTATIRCDRLTEPARRLDVTGYWLSADVLDAIVAGLELPRLPAAGLTIGVVLDPQGRPASGYSVRSDGGGALKYLTPSYEVVPAGTATTPSGLFAVVDDPYSTEYTASDGTSPLTASGLGGRVHGRVTIVVLQLAPVSS